MKGTEIPQPFSSSEYSEMAVYSNVTASLYHILKESECIKYMYRNDPKFSDRQVWANSVEPDQTANQEAV